MASSTLPTDGGTSDFPELNFTRQVQDGLLVHLLATYIIPILMHQFSWRVPLKRLMGIICEEKLEMHIITSIDPKSSS